jgi:hypothetical protein
MFVGTKYLAWMIVVAFVMFVALRRLESTKLVGRLTGAIAPTT